MLNKNGGFGILFQMLNAVGDLLRNYLGLCTPFTRKRRNCPSSPPPAPSSGQAEARSCSAYKGLTGTGVVPTSTKCQRGARAGWDLHNPEFKEKESYPIQESSKGEKWVLELVGAWAPSDAAAPRREGDTEKRMACGQWKGLLRNRPCTPAQSSALDRGWTTCRGEGSHRGLHPSPGWHAPPPCSISSELFHMIWKREGAPDGHCGASCQFRWELREPYNTAMWHFLHPRSLGANCTCWDYKLGGILWLCFQYISMLEKGFCFFSPDFKSWSIIDLQYCVSFRCIAKWSSYTYICRYLFFFRFFSFIGYYKILSIVPCALQ